MVPTEPGALEGNLTPAGRSHNAAGNGTTSLTAEPASGVGPDCSDRSYKTVGSVIPNSKDSIRCSPK